MGRKLENGRLCALDKLWKVVQKSIAAQIHTTQANYILSPKASHPALFQQVALWVKTTLVNFHPTRSPV
jgi:hypothetical protein